MQLSPDGVWSWHPEHVKVGEVVLGPTYRFMKLDTLIESDSVRIFADCASSTAPVLRQQLDQVTAL